MKNVDLALAAHFAEKFSKTELLQRTRDAEAALRKQLEHLQSLDAVDDVGVATAQSMTEEVATLRRAYSLAK